MKKSFLTILSFLTLSIVAGVFTWKHFTPEHGDAAQEFGSAIAIASPESPTVAGVSDGFSDDANDTLPIVFESRNNATEPRPIRKEGVYDLAVPTAHASVVMDADSGIVLEENNSHEERQIASLTKLMTTIVVLDHVKDLNEPVTIDEEAVYADGTKIGCPRSGFCNGVRLHVGEQISVESLLKAALMNSANDAAIALGKHVGKTQSGFADIMNKRAQEMELRNTHFCTPSGLEPDGHESECYSSAFDVARIASEALKYDIIWQFARLPDATITSLDGKYSHDIFNTDVLLGEHPELIGTKTGFTPLAGYSLVAISYDPTRKHRIVSVVLNDPYRWDSVKRMFSWAFDSHYWR